MEFERNFSNIAERKFLGVLLSIIKPIKNLPTPLWAWENRLMSSIESSIQGKFDTGKTPAFKYIYNVVDNSFIHIVGLMKSSQIGASEVENNIIGRKMDLDPCNTVIFFPGTSLLKEYSKKRLKPFFNSCRVLREKCNIGIVKPSHDYFAFPGGSVALRTLGSIQSVLSSPLPFLIYEEFAQVKADVAKQGDPLGLGIGRQKSYHIGRKKILGFSTPTFKDFCNMEKLYKSGTRLVFKAKCHHCGELIELSGWTMDSFLQYEEYPNRYIDETYGKYDPLTAYFACTSCLTEWSFDQKNINIKEGLNFGFIDDCGDFTYGWHPTEGEVKIYTLEEYLLLEPSIDKNVKKKHLKEKKISLRYTFQYPEILSTFEATSDAIALASKKIIAELAVEKGDETLLKDYTNNSKGVPYSSGITSLEAEDMKLLRSNYPEGICPMDGLVLTAGIDVQDNRFAYVIRAWGRNNNSWLVKWEEIFGDVKVQEFDKEKQCFLGIWGELFDKVINIEIPHSSGKKMKVDYVSIDSGDNTQLVYDFVGVMDEWYKARTISTVVLATKGVRDLKYSKDEIYAHPSLTQAENDKQVIKTLAETKGVTLFKLGAHRAHDEILERIMLNKKENARSNIYFFNEQSYGQYEEQMTSCRKLLDHKSSYKKSIYKLITGKRKEAMDAEKNALHAAYALQIRNYTHQHWKNLEDYYHG